MMVNLALEQGVFQSVLSAAVQRLHTDIRISCDTTGLSEKAVKILSSMEKSDVEKLSKLIEFYNTIR